jgi:hypothetical protein
MADLWINWRDENGESGSVRVDKSPFTIGRQPTCDLAIANSKLSREHAAIERSGKAYILTDRGSSNGTELNALPLIVPAEVHHGDRADLGGGLKIEFEFRDEEPPGVLKPRSEAARPAAADLPPTAVVPASSDESTGFPVWLFIVGPGAVVILLVVVIGAVILLGGGSNEVSEINTQPRRSSDGPVEERTAQSRTATPTGTASPATSNESIPLPSPSNLGENAKVEQNAAAFLRRVAQNDPKAFLTAEQAKQVSVKAKQLSGSSTLAANFESARRSAAGIKTLAAAKNLTPQLLATAALTKLGGSRGDVLQTSRSIADILERLQTQIGSELYDDSLMMIAVYDRGERGDFMSLRNTLQDLATKNPESARSIRSIWFLLKQGKITMAEFDFALRFLAIGTISQNPKDFGVSAEPLIL